MTLASNWIVMCFLSECFQYASYSLILLESNIEQRLITVILKHILSFSDTQIHSLNPHTLAHIIHF